MTSGPVRDSTLSGWIAARRPPVPVGFARWMAPAEGHTAAGPESLVDEALRALRRVGEAEDDARGVAFDLLAADGFATWACEAALDDDDPESALFRVLDTLLE